MYYKINILTGKNQQFSIIKYLFFELLAVIFCFFDNNMIFFIFFLLNLTLNLTEVSTVNRNERVGWSCRSWSENLRS